ncbi:MAG: hypothetical protein R3D58_15085 [Saprospiraceae bacterium]
MPNREEQIIIDCLRLQGFEKIEYEPDGNIPPDILLNENIAIEVRRLNQNQSTESGFKGLEQDEYAIHGLLNKIFDGVSDETFERSAFVGYMFERPLPEKKVLKKKVKEILENHKPIIHEHREYKVSDVFNLRLMPSSKKLRKQFQFGMSSDEDSGGFVVGLIYENLKLIIKEKEEKVKNYRGNYPEWWLAVVDTIGYGLAGIDLEQFHNLPKLEFQFDRILLVSPADASGFTYLYEN